MTLAQHAGPTPQARDEARPDASRRRSRKRLWSRVIGVAAVALSAFLIWHTLRQHSFDQIVASVKAIPASRLAAAGGFALASYVALTGFDWLGLRYLGKPLPYWKAALASFTSLGLGHSIGFAGLSSGAIRYRFYSRWGLGVGDVAKLVVFCGATVGLGLLALGGAALLLRPDLGARVTGFDEGWVVALGVACLALTAGYVALAAWGPKAISIRGWSVEIPPVRLALGQIAVGVVNFALVAGCLHQALAAGAEVGYLSVASVYVIANTATMITHVPGGLGVIESVVGVLLPGADLIGGLLAFRAIYFFVPLAIGGITFGVSELVFRRRKRAG
jgi:glycosyltransferase 2 family protein